jgi:hypothetical protein
MYAQKISKKILRDVYFLLSRDHPHVDNSLEILGTNLGYKHLIYCTRNRLDDWMSQFNLIISQPFMALIKIRDPFAVPKEILLK